jgi:UDP-glucose 4-epimerase
MKILVTGGGGFIGSNLIDKLIENKHNLWSIDNYSSGYKLNENKKCIYINHDVRKIYDYSFLTDFDIIFHLAAQPRIQPSFIDPNYTLDVNINGTINILEYAKKYKIPLIYAGSSSCHGGIYESPYAWSKYIASDMCKMYSKVYKLPTTICRFYNVYGHNHIRQGEYATVIGIFENQYLNGHPLTIIGDGEQRRDFTHVDDIVDGLIKCMYYESYGEVFELGRGRDLSINEIANMFNTKIEYLQDTPGNYRKTLSDSSTSRDLLKWEAKLNLEDYIRKFINENN